MPNYDATLTIRVDASLADIASKIGRAFDPDVGGADSFRLDPDGLTISTTTPCTSDFKISAKAMLADHSILFSACSLDYAVRWTGLTPLTLNECEAFCVSARMYESGINNA